MNDTAPGAVRITEPPRRTIVLLASAAFCSAVNLRICDPLLPQVAQSFGTTVGAASAIVTAFAVGYGLVQLVFGPVGDRCGKYLVVALTTLLAGAATAVCATMPTLDNLATARFIVGIFCAAAIPLAFAWIGDAFSFERRQGELARFLSGQFTGIILGQAAGGFLGDHFGWRVVFLIVAAFHFAAGLAMLIELRLNPGAQPLSAAPAVNFAALARQLMEILGRPWVRVMLATVFVEAFAMYGAFAYIGADLHHRFGVGFGIAGAVLSVYGGGAIAYSFSARKLLARLGEGGLALAGGLLCAIAYAGLASAPHIAAVPPVMVLMGLAFYMLHNTLQTHATQMAPEARGLGVSLFAFALFMGQSIGVALAAPVIDRWGAPPVYAVSAVFLPLSALWFVNRLRARHR